MKKEEFFVGEAVHHPQRILLFLEAVLNFYKKVFLDLVYSFAYNNFKTVSS